MNSKDKSIYTVTEEEEEENESNENDCAGSLAEILIRDGKGEAEVRAHKALSILQAKDEELKELQSRLSLLEKLAGKLENVENAKSKESTDIENPSQDISVYNQTAQMDIHSINGSRILYMTQGTNDYETNEQASTPIQKISTSRTDKINNDNFVVAHLQVCNKELRNAVSNETMLRIQDLNRFYDIVNSFHKMLKAIKAGKQIQIQNHLTSIICHKEDELSQSILSAAIKNTKKSDDSDTDLNDNNQCSLMVKMKPPDETRLIKQLVQVEKELEDLRKIYNASIEKTSQEQKAREAIQSAWAARFRVQANNMNRLEKRYRSVCKFLRRKGVTKFKRHKRDDKIKPQNQSNKEVIGKEEVTIKSTGLLRGRLDAAHNVMTKQRSAILELQEQIDKKNLELQKFKKRLLRIETQNASNAHTVQSQSELAAESDAKYKGLVHKYNNLKRESEVLQDTLRNRKGKFAGLQRKYNSLVEENEYCLKLLSTYKSESSTRIQTLNEELSKSKQDIEQFESRTVQMHEHFKKMTEIASERITLANMKLREFFRTIEIFLKLVCKSNTPSAILEAEKAVASILNISPMDLPRLTNSTRNSSKFQDWVKGCRFLVIKDSFADDLANFLYNAATNKNTNQILEK